MTASTITAWLVAVAAFSALGSVLNFAARYARLPWWTSEVGRTLMLGGLAVGGLALASATAWMAIALGIGGAMVKVVLAACWLAVTVKYIVMARNVGRRKPKPTTKPKEATHG